jgi:hypothetical protein
VLQKKTPWKIIHQYLMKISSGAAIGVEISNHFKFNCQKSAAPSGEHLKHFLNL